MLGIKWQSYFVCHKYRKWSLFGEDGGKRGRKAMYDSYAESRNGKGLLSGRNRGGIDSEFSV
jgi:hypothetical protein